MSKIQLVIDIGSKFTTISQLGKGFVFKDASIVYISNRHNKVELIEIGRSVIGYIGNNRVEEQVVYPIKEGVIYHERAAILMYKEYINNVVGKSILRPRISVIACVSCGLTNVEKHDIEKVLLQAGANEVIILESPLAVYAADNDGTSQCIVDIGASKTEIAVVNKDGIVTGCSVNIGGDTLNQAISDYLLDSKKCRLAPEKIEKIKKQLLNLSDNELFIVNENVKEIGTNNIVKMQISSREIKSVVEPLMNKICDGIFTVLNSIPEIVANDVANNGITLCGGSSRMNGISNYLEDQIGLVIKRVNDPENATSTGGIYYLNHRDKLAQVLNVVNLK